jgi:cell division protein FtsQ
MASERGERRARAQDVRPPSRGLARIDVARWAPSARSLLIGFLLLGGAAASYGIARATPLFAIERLEVVGGSPEIRDEARAALGGLEGRSLVGLRAADVEEPLAAVPDVAGATYDRAFPHTLRVVVFAERPLLVLRREDDSWLVSVRGRVLRRLPPRTLERLPRLWLPRSIDVRVGERIGDPGATRSVRILAAAVEELAQPIRTVRFAGDDATVVLRSGVELRVGSEHDIRLKLAVASVILPRLDPTERYLDVAVPARPVAG